MFVLNSLLSSANLMPHGFSGFWDARLVWLHLLSDGLIFLAYMTIPVTLLRLMKSRDDLPFNWMFVCFGVFIVAGGLTHAMDFWNLWHAAYWFAGTVKAIAAIASIATAILLFRLVPLVAALPSGEDFRLANEELSRQAAKTHAEEAKFRAILESAPDAIVITNAGGHIVLVNAETEKLFGYRREELFGEDADSLVAQRFRSKYHAYRDDCAARPLSLTRPQSTGAGTELCGLRKDGSEFPAEISLGPLETPEGVLISSAIRDVTRQRKMQQLLRSANLELEKHVAERTANLESAKQELELVVAQQERAENEIREFNLGLESRVHLRTSELQAVVAELAFEMAERKRAERTLKEQTAKLHDFAAIMELAHDAIIVRNVQGHITYWNRGAEQLYGWHREDVRGKPIHELLATRFPVSREETDAALLKRGRWEGELVHSRKDGPSITVTSSMSLQRDENLTPVAVLEINSDITARKEAEEVARAYQENIRRLNDDLLRRSADLEASNHELESFSYSVSHDLRAPLRHIDGFAHLLLEDHGRHLEPEAHRYVQKIMQGAAQMGTLVEDLLDLARVGRAGPKRKLVDLNEIVRIVVADLLSDPVHCEVSWQLELLPTANCDPGLVKIVLTNLVSNAMKFSRGSSTPTIQIGTFPTAGEEVIFVRDNGVGFDPQYADKLFGVFQRLHTAEEFEGTGVGLATVQRIVRNHGGRIWAESQLGHGATFFFYARRASRVRAHRGSPMRGEKCLTPRSSRFCSLRTIPAMPSLPCTPSRAAASRA